MRSEVVIVVHDPNGRSASFWNDVLENVVIDHDAEIVEAEEQ